MAVVTPATLTVRLRAVSASPELNVPGVNWNDSMFLDWGAEEGYFIPSFPTKRAMTANAYSITTLSIAPSFPDYNYSMQFFGPSFRCRDAHAPGEATLFDAIRPDYINYTLQDVLNSYNGTPQLLDPKGFSLPQLVYDGRPAFPRTDNVIVLTTIEQNISCTLWNTSFDITFNVSQGVQAIQEHNITLETPYKYHDWSTYIMGFEAVASAMTTILTGHIERDYSGATHFGSGDADDQNNTNTWDPIYNTGLVVCPELGNHLMNTFPEKTLTLAQSQPRWMCRAGSLASAIEDLSKNFTYTLFAVPDVT